MSIEDVLVNGPPWNTRVAVRAHVWATDPDGTDAYANRAVLMIRARWGKIRDQEDYEDTERATAFDDHRSQLAVGGPATVGAATRHEAADTTGDRVGAST